MMWNDVEQASGVAGFEVPERDTECADDYSKIEDVIQEWDEQIYGLADKPEASDPHLGMSRPPCVLYGVTHIDQSSVSRFSGCV